MPTKRRFEFVPVLSLLVSAALWGVIWYPLRLLEKQGMESLWLVLCTYGAAMFIGVLIIAFRRCRFQLSWTLLFLAIASGWCNTAFILAVLEGNVVRVILLFYLSPLWTVVLGMLVLDERLSRYSWLTLISAMCGALIMLWDPAIGMPWPRDVADWLAISSGMSFALSNVLVRKMQQVSIEVKAVSTWGGVFMVAGLLLLVLPRPWVDVDLNALFYAMALGASVFVLMTLALIYGVTHMPVHRSAVILLFELVAGTVSAQLLTNEIVQPNEWTGGVLIIIAAWFEARRHLRTK
jgi:drug/metabolite transporter (DMT)-like permease